MNVDLNVYNYNCNYIITVNIWFLFRCHALTGLCTCNAGWEGQICNKKHGMHFTTIESTICTSHFKVKNFKHHHYHCVKSVSIRSYSRPYFPAFQLNTGSISPYSVRMRENTDQNNSEYWHFSRSAFLFIEFFLIGLLR